MKKNLQNEVSPPGWSGTVKAMKKHKDKIDNPFALAWSMKNKGDKAHYKPEPKDSSKDKKEPEKKEKYKDEKDESFKFKSFSQFLEEKGALPKNIEKARKKPGGSNVGKERESSGPKEGPFCGPSGGAPKGSFPVTSKKQAAAAKRYAHNAPNPEGVKKCADRVEGKKKD